MADTPPLAARPPGLPGLLGLLGMVQNREWGLLFPVALLRIPIFIVAALLASFLSYKAVHNQLSETGILHEDRVSLAAFLDGSVHKPFAYRFLTPVLIGIAQNHLGITAAVLPGPLKAKAEAMCATTTSNPRPSCDTVVAYAAVSMGFCALFLMTFYWFVHRMYGHPLIALAGMGFAYLCMNAIIRLGLSHTYDFPVMFLGTALLLCLDYRKPLLFTALLAVGFLMKETLVLYAGTALFVNFGRMPLARNVAFFIVQIALFIVLHGAVRLHFAGNLGEGHEYYLPGQIFFFTEHIVLPILLPMLFAVLLVFYDFHHKPETIRRASIIIAPWLVLFMIGGVPKELRVIFEIFPLVALLMYDSCVRLVLGQRNGAG